MDEDGTSQQKFFVLQIMYCFYLFITRWALPYISYVSKLTFIDIELCYTPSVIVVLSTTGLLNWSSIIHNKMPVENWLSELEEEG